MEKFSIYNPYNGNKITDLEYMSESVVGDKISKGYSLSHNFEKRLRPYQRIEVLEQFLSLIKENQKEIIKTAIEEGGKPYIDTSAEMDRAIEGIKIGIRSISDISGREIPMRLNLSSNKRIAYTYKEPVGLVFGISAFNHPINLIIHQIVPAIAAGCPILIKPAKKTPLTCIKLVDLINSTSLPKNWVQLILCQQEVTHKIASDNRIKFLAYIGSEKIGWELRSKLAPGTRCSLEHGGAAPVIIEKDADLNDVVPLIVKGGFYHSGQVCVSVQRVYISDKISEKFIEKILALTSNLIIGDPSDEKFGIEIGPMISKENVQRIDDLVQEAIKGGAKLLCGGRKFSDTIYAPTILLNPPEDSDVSQKEIFGPVICLYTYSSKEEAIKLANSIPYSFQAAVFGHNLDSILDTVQKIKATTVMVNDHTAFRVDWMPFGGREKSGMAMGGIIDSINDFTDEKMVVIRSKSIM